MKAVAKSVVLALTFFLSLCGETLRADNYGIDPSHTSIVFGINHLGYSFTYGRFNRVNGSFVWNNANPATGQFQLAIEAASLDTNDVKRDEHLRGPDFFNAKQFPVISFQSMSIAPQQGAPDKFTVSGNLTIHGITRQISLPLQKLGEGNGPYGNYRCGFLCQTSFKRSDYGMTTMIPNIGDEVAITISFEGLRQGAPSASGTVSTSGTAGASGAKAGSGSSGNKGGSAPKAGSGAKGSSGAKAGSGAKGSSGKK